MGGPEFHTKTKQKAKTTVDGGFSTEYLFIPWKGIESVYNPITRLVIIEQKDILRNVLDSLFNNLCLVSRGFGGWWGHTATNELKTILRKIYGTDELHYRVIFLYSSFYEMGPFSKTLNATSIFLLSDTENSPTPFE